MKEWPMEPREWLIQLESESQSGSRLYLVHHFSWSKFEGRWGHSRGAISQQSAPGLQDEAVHEAGTLCGDGIFHGTEPSVFAMWSPALPSGSQVISVSSPPPSEPPWSRSGGPCRSRSTLSWSSEIPLWMEGQAQGVGPPCSATFQPPSTNSRQTLAIWDPRLL